MTVREFFANQTKREMWRVGSPFRFIFWGGVNALAGYSIYALLIQRFSYLVSYTIAYILGIAISYFVNSKFVFDKKLKLSKALKYPLVYVVHYLLSTVFLYCLVQVLGVNKLIAPLLILLVTVPVTFVLTRRVVSG